MRAYCLVVAGLLGLGGCARSTGILPIGPDGYTVTEMRAPVVGGGEEAQRAVFGEADAFCREQNRSLVVISAAPGGDLRTPYYPTEFTATFRCQAAGTQRN